MARTFKHTNAVDGYRWELCSHTEAPAFCNWTGFSAHAQQKCALDSGLVHYRYCGVKARFDTAEARAKFIALFSAKDWARA